MHWFGNVLFSLGIDGKNVEVTDWVRFGDSPEECAKNVGLMRRSESFSILDDFVSKNWANPLNSEDCLKLGQNGVLFESPADSANESALSSSDFDIEKFLLSAGAFPNKQELRSTVRQIGLALAKERLRDRGEARDRYVVQAIHAIDDMDRILNLVSNRVFEWYGIHFPELFDLVRDNLQFLRLVRLGLRNNFSDETLSELSEKRKRKILEVKGESLGVSLPEDDLRPVQELASFGVEIAKVRDHLDSYVDEIMTEVAPNLTALIGGRLGARLIARTGSLENLAKKPSSTMQVLGAEKALFRSLKEGTKPPKHGYIFQSPLIHRAPIHQRGKIARVLAGKLSIASRVDYFSGEFIADVLQKEVDTRIKEIVTTYAEPPKRKRKTKGRSAGTQKTKLKKRRRRSRKNRERENHDS